MKTPLKLSASTSRRTRSGWSNANWSPIAPPSESPTMLALSTSSSSSNAARSPAQAGIENSPS